MSIILFSVISLVFFLRGEIPFFPVGLSPSYLIPPLVVSLLIWQLLSNNLSITKNGLPIVAFFIFSLATILLHVFFFEGHVNELVLIFSEMTLNLFIYMTAYNAYKNFDNVALMKLHYYSGVVFSLPVIIIAASLEKVRRIGAGGEEDSALPVAVNHIGHSLTICIIFGCLYLLVHMKNGKLHSTLLISAGIILMIVSMGLTGSKAGMVGFVFFCLIFAGRFLARRFILYLLMLLFLVIVFSLFYIDFDKFSNLFDRFTLEGFERAVDQRNATLKEAFYSIPDGIKIFGYPWMYEPINSIEPIHYPHNYLISILLHLGVLPLMFFVLYVAVTMIRLLNNLILSHRPVALFFLCAFVAVLVYVMTSGRLTRVMTIFWVFGLVDAYLDSGVNKNRALKQKNNLNNINI